jgi:hypothetical protein
MTRTVLLFLLAWQVNHTHVQCYNTHTSGGLSPPQEVSYLLLFLLLRRLLLRRLHIIFGFLNFA